MGTSYSKASAEVEGGSRESLSVAEIEDIEDWRHAEYQKLKAAEVELKAEMDRIIQKLELSPLPFTTPQMLIGGGLMFFGAIPLQVALGRIGSTCAGGAAAGPYVVAGAQIAAASALDMWVSHGRWPEEKDDFAKEFLAKGLHAMTKLKGLDWSGLLFAFGKLELADLMSDSIQPAQVVACEMEDPEFVVNFQRGWQRVPFLDRLRLSDLFYIMLSVTYLIQFVAYSMSVQNVFRITKLRAKLRADLLLDQKPSKNNTRIEHMMKNTRELQQHSFLAKEFSNVASALDQLGAGIAARTCRETSELLAFAEARLSKSRLLRREDTLETKEEVEAPFEKAGAAAKASAQAAFIIRVVFTRVLCEAAPALYLAITFLVLKWPTLGWLGQTKTVIMISLSAFTCIHKAWKCIESRDAKGVIIGALILVFVLFMASKLVGIALCKDSHHMSMFRCVSHVNASVAE